MRRWLAIFLLVFIPLQFTWAAASAYSQHENWDAANHFGHHAHEHKMSADQETPDTMQSGNIESDCNVCHAGCAHALTGTIVQTPVITAVVGVVDYRAHTTAPPSVRPERPQWRFLA